VEIDEDEGYAKAKSLIKRGLQVIVDMPDVKEKDQIVSQMQKKVRLIEMYLGARACVKTDPKKAIQTAVEILRSQVVDDTLRSDDVYVLMIQASVTHGNFKSAYIDINKNLSERD
jgi:hypothetical protein